MVCVETGLRPVSIYYLQTCLCLLFTDLSLPVIYRPVSTCYLQACLYLLFTDLSPLIIYIPVSTCHLHTCFYHFFTYLSINGKGLIPVYFPTCQAYTR